MSGFVCGGSISVAGNSSGTDPKKAAFDWSRFRSTIPSGRASLISGEIESRRRDENSQSASFPSDLKIKVASPEKEKRTVRAVTLAGQTCLAESERPSRSRCNVLTIQPGAEATVTEVPLGSPWSC